MKDNFLLKKSQRQVFEALSDEEAGKLIKGIFKYLDTGDSGLIGMMNAIFIPIKKDIDENEKKYQKTCEKNRENINKRWNKANEDIQTNTSVYERIPNDTDNNHISYITNHNIINQDILEDKGLREKKPFREIIDYLNKKTGSNYRYNTKATQDKINARLNEGFKLDDFIAVIDKKCQEWNGTDMQVYLRPETLFGTKFESYLNQKIKGQDPFLNAVYREKMRGKENE